MPPQARVSAPLGPALDAVYRRFVSFSSATGQSTCTNMRRESDDEATRLAVQIIDNIERESRRSVKSISEQEAARHLDDLRRSRNGGHKPSGVLIRLTARRCWTRSEPGNRVEPSCARRLWAAAGSCALSWIASRAFGARNDAASSLGAAAPGRPEGAGGAG